MFAIAIWDEPRQKLHLARDPLGIKQLYYCWNGRGLLFASESARAVRERLDFTSSQFG
jgi:asparagine synthase (glutamine-hydrolysing)